MPVAVVVGLQWGDEGKGKSHQQDGRLGGDERSPQNAQRFDYFNAREMVGQHPKRMEGKEALQCKLGSPKQHEGHAVFGVRNKSTWCEERRQIIRSAESRSMANRLQARHEVGSAFRLFDQQS